MIKRFALPNWFIGTALLGTFSFVFFLYYIDEGYYDLRWMKDPSNWLFFFIFWFVLYWIVISGGVLQKKDI